MRPLFESLTRARVIYCVLRGSEGGAEPAREVDLLVSPACRAAFEATVRAARFLRRPDPAPFKAVFVHYADGVATCLDVHWRAVQYGIVYMDAAAMLERREREEGMFRLSREDELMHLVFHNFLRRGELRVRSIDEIRGLLAGPIDCRYIRWHLDRFGLTEAFETVCEWVRRGAAGGDDAGDVRGLVRKAALEARAGNRWRSLCVRLRGRPGRGGVVALVGPDGSGKSTVLAAVRARARQIPGLKIEPAYLGPWGQMDMPWVPALRRLGIRPYKDDGAAAGQPSAWNRALTSVGWSVKGAIFYCATYAELLGRYIRRVLWRTRRGSWVVSDRYITDLRYLYKSAPIERHAFWRALVCHLFPKPDLFILLDNQPEVVAERKTQLNAGEVRTVRSLCLDAIRPYPHEVIVTDRPPQAIADDVLLRILRLSETR